jgi:dethiobiotin synthetase
VKSRFLFVTGTDTGVGKTVFAGLLTRRLRERSVRVVALKPVCSGGRGDARALRAAAGNVLSLDEVNPWHFRAPIAPVLAARKEQQRLQLRQVVAHIRCVAKKFDLVVVEGAGGLLSPLGEDFDSRDLLLALGATPIVVCPNRLGAVNQALLSLAALPPAIARNAPVVLVAQARPGAAARNNAALLGEKIGRVRIHEFPRLRRGFLDVAPPLRVRLDHLIRSLDLRSRLNCS